MKPLIRYSMPNKFSCIVADPPYGFGDSLTQSSTKRGANANYSTLSISALCELPVKDLAAKDGCILCLWVPSSMLQDGLNIMKAWGFSQRQTYVWVKVKKQPLKFINTKIKTTVDIIKNIEVPTSKNQVNKLISGFINTLDTEIGKTLDNMLSFYMGRLLRATHEICLIGINNNGIYKKLKNKSQRSVSFDTVEAHSKKPEHLQNSLDLMFLGDKLELFARRQRAGWTCIGNQAPVTFGEDIRKSIEDLINGKVEDVVNVQESIALKQR